MNVSVRNMKTWITQREGTTINQEMFILNSINSNITKFSLEIRRNFKLIEARNEIISN